MNIPIVRWDASYNRNDRSIAINMFYGNSTPLVNTYESTWDDSYQMVHHFYDGTAYNSSDSTSNGYDSVSGNVTTVTSGAMGNHKYFSNSNFFLLGDVVDITSNQLTFELWLKSDGNLTGALLSKFNSVNGSNYRLTRYGTNGLTLKIYDNGGTTPSEFSLNGCLNPGEWQHVAVTFDGALSGEDNTKLFVDGEFVGSGEINANIADTTTYLRIGQDAFSGAYAGWMDEVRISSVVRSPEWVKLAYNNQSLGGNSIKVGMEKTTGPMFSGTKLNTMVYELINKTLPANSGFSRSYDFDNQWPTWIYVKADVNIMGSHLRIKLDGTLIPLQTVIDTNSDLEGMYYVATSSMHTVTIEASSGSDIEQLIVRSIPVIAMHEVNSLDDATNLRKSKHSWEFLKSNVVQNFNVLKQDMQSGANYNPIMTEWTSSTDKKWLGGASVAAGDIMNYPTDTTIFNNWKSAMQKSANGNGGTFVDEFTTNFTEERFRKFAQLITDLKADASISDQFIYGYSAGDKPDLFETVVDALIANNGYILPEFYVPETDTENSANNSHIKKFLIDAMLGWRNSFSSDIERYTIVTLSPTNMLLGYSINRKAYVDLKRHLDLQLHATATNSAFDNLYGINFWTTYYADEEIIRWISALVRHYFIEGNTNRLSDRYQFEYNNNYVIDPHFRNVVNASGVPSYRGLNASPYT